MDILKPYQERNNSLDSLTNHVTSVSSNKNVYLSNDQLLSTFKCIENTCNMISFCPHCSSSHIVKNGKNRLKKQRYKCKNCEKIFCSSTFSPLYHSKKSLNYWIKYLECMSNNLSVRSSAEKTGVHRNTAFYWRHKILHSLKSTLPNKLSGIIEIDETHFNQNNKDRSINYSLINVLSNEEIKIKVCVISCADRYGNIFSKTACLNYANYSVVDAVIASKIPNNSILCTKNHYKYESFARKHKLEIHKISSNSFNSASIFNLSRVRYFHKSLHSLISKFRGVATKYMDLYICWNKWNTLNSNVPLLQIIENSLLDIISFGKNLRIKDFKFINSLTFN